MNLEYIWKFNLTPKLNKTIYKDITKSNSQNPNKDELCTFQYTVCIINSNYFPVTQATLILQCYISGRPVYEKKKKKKTNLISNILPKRVEHLLSEKLQWQVGGYHGR